MAKFSYTPPPRKKRVYPDPVLLSSTRRKTYNRTYKTFYTALCQKCGSQYKTSQQPNGSITPFCSHFCLVGYFAHKEIYEEQGFFPDDFLSDQELLEIDKEK